MRFSSLCSTELSELSCQGDGATVARAGFRLDNSNSVLVVRMWSHNSRCAKVGRSCTAPGYEWGVPTWSKIRNTDHAAYTPETCEWRGREPSPDLSFKIRQTATRLLCRLRRALSFFHLVKSGLFSRESWFFWAVCATGQLGLKFYLWTQSVDRLLACRHSPATALR